MAESKWTPEHAITIYELACNGLSIRAIAGTMGVNKATLTKWLRTKPTAKAAYKRGKGRAGGKTTNTETFVDYCYKHLPGHLRELWREINEWVDDPYAQQRLDAMFDHHGKHARQHLFIHAMVASNFNASAACRKVGISRNILDLWKQDPDFAALLDEIQWHKANFFDSALVGLIRGGDTAATIFANKTFNHDRYPSKVAVEADVVQTEGGLAEVPLDAVLQGVSLQARQEMLVAIRKAKARK